MKQDYKQKFIRQISRREIGETGQQRIADSSVLVIGAGGLGCPVLQYLAAAGVGHLGVMDFDRVDLSNLHRQILFSETDLGKPKAECAAHRIMEMNPHCKVTYFNAALNNQLAMDHFPAYDVIVDGTDQIAIRYLISDACKITGKPWVHGAVDGWEGRWVHFPENSNGYYDLFPEPPDPMLAGSCEINGIPGPVPGVVGLNMAVEILKQILELQSAETIMHHVNLLTGNSQQFTLPVLHREKMSAAQFLDFDYTAWALQLHHHSRTTEN